jgi:hypothetical protein
MTDVRKNFRSVKLDRIIVDEGYDIRIIKTPRQYAPFFCTTTLIIGAQTLLTFPPAYMRALLIRRIGQYAGKGSRHLAWFCYQVDIWQQYATACKERKSIAYRPLAWIFLAYVRFYRALTVYLQQQYELEGDRCALEMVHSEEFNKALSYDAMVRDYLDNRYWPAIRKMTRRSDVQFYMPYTNMSHTVFNGLKKYKMSIFFANKFEEEPNSETQYPSFRQRMEQLGYEEAEWPSLPEKLDYDAAHLYLGETANLVIQVMDNWWMKHSDEHHNATHSELRLI